MKTTLSKKRESKLYSDVADKVTAARVQIALLFKHEKIWKDIDNILSDLNREAPDAALKVFEKKESI